MKHLGRFEVSARRQDVARFTAAVAGEASRRDVPVSVPATFPVIWLGCADVKVALRDALATYADEEARAPVHLSQSVACNRPLSIDTPYWMELSLSRPDENGVFRIEAQIFDACNEKQASFAGRLTLVPIAEQP